MPTDLHHSPRSGTPIVPASNSLERQLTVARATAHSPQHECNTRRSTGSARPILRTPGPAVTLPAMNPQVDKVTRSIRRAMCRDTGQPQRPLARQVRQIAFNWDGSRAEAPVPERLLWPDANPARSREIRHRCRVPALNWVVLA